MTYCAKERLKWKARLTQWVEKSPDVSRPVQKLMVEVLFGILSSGSLQLSSIARSLKEPTHLHHTLKRLSRMLSRHGEVAVVAEKLLLSDLGAKVTEDMVLAIDPGDLNRDGAQQSELISRIRDGSTGNIVNGYPLISVVARDPKSGATLPLLTRLLSSRRYTFKSENSDILQTMEEVQSHLTCKPLWVIDRGGDRGTLWQSWIKEETRILVRAANKRFWFWRESEWSAQQIAKQLPLKHSGKLKREASSKKKESKTVRFGITTVRLRECPEKTLSMVVVRHGKQQPMVLVTTDKIRGRRQGERLIQAYLDRWSCEEGYRFSKQGFDLEKVQARKITTLQNLIALASLAWGVLASHQNEAAKLLIAAKRQKRKKPLIFPFYSLLQGWQRLFEGTKSVFYDWWRRPKRQKTDQIEDLFKNLPTLVPI